MKKLGIAAALMLCAFGASASNFRAADQVYVPIAGHAGGSSGTFITDAFIANLSGDSVDVSVIYVPLGPNEGADAPRLLEELRGKITLRAHERKELLDVFVNTLGKTAASNPLGLLVFNGCKANSSCGPETQDPDGYSENFRLISVQTRIYQITTAGANPPTTGQLFTGIPWYNFVSELQSNVELDKVFITGLTNTGSAGQVGTFRSNIGVVNASEYSKTEIVFRLYQGSLSEADKKGEAVRSIGPLGNNQYGLATLFPGITGSNFFVTVEQRNSIPINGTVPATCERGCPAFLAYGSVLDNISGDATTMEAQYLKALSAEAIDIIYPLGSGKGPLRRLVRH
ncbi:MAG: hypothetical protein ACXW31_09070 [Thermoanaerobaculia bacterium]